MKMFNSTYELYTGIPICIATKTIQRRRHRKKRIDKKWLKRYGCIEIDYIPHGESLIVGGVLYLTKRDFEEIRNSLPTRKLRKKFAKKMLGNIKT